MSMNNKKPGKKPVLKCGPGRTKTSFRDETDINKMVAKFRATGIAPRVSEVVARYADVSDIPTYAEAFNQVQEAQKMFLALPSAIRTRFGNNPGQLLEFCSDKNNRDEAIKLGLVEKPKIVAPREETEAITEKKPGKKTQGSRSDGKPTEAKPKE